MKLRVHAGLACGLCALSLVVDALHLKGTLRLGFETRLHNSSDRSAAPNVVFTHLLKAGGTTIDAELGSIFAVSEDPRAYRRQDSLFSIDAPTLATSLGKFQQDLTPAAATGFATFSGSDVFRIGNTRNPCNYLLSMWAFQSSPYGDSTGHGKIPHQCLADTLDSSGTDPEELYGKDIDQHFSTDEDINRFRRWVRASAGKKIHYLSYRSYLAAQVDPFATHIPSWDDGQFHGCLGKLNASEESRISDRLEMVDLAERYDCLIHTETLHDDMRSCMLKYAERVEDVTVRERLKGKVEDVFAVASTSNEGSHGKCEQYFDEDTAAFVWAREGAFASKLGYSQCCGRPQ